MNIKILVKKVDGGYFPKQGNPNDAAYDIIAMSEPNIVGVKFERPLDGINAWSKIDYIEYKTGLFLSPQDVTSGKKVVKPHIKALPRSSVSKKNLVLANSVGTIDNGYTGEICVRFKYIFQPEDYIILPEAGRNRIYAILNPSNIYAKGDKIAQIEGALNFTLEFEEVESLGETKRGSGGFGSTN